jgi:hypothetical protein
MDKSPERDEPSAARASQSPKLRRKAEAALPSIDSPKLAPPDWAQKPIDAAASEGRLLQSRSAAEDRQRPLASAITELVNNTPRQEQTVSEDQASAAPTTTAASGRSFTPKALPPIAAAIALAMCIGAAAGSLATIGFELATSSQGEDNLAATRALRASIAQINSDLAKLKSGVEASGANFGNELGQLTARIERTEKAQGEPAAEIAKLNEAIDRLEKRGQTISAAPTAALPTASPQSSSSDVTGSIPLPPASRVSGKDLSRVPVVHGWVLRNIYDGTALIQGPRGLVEVEIGDPLPGGGRVESIQRQAGRWVVVTSRGLIVAR